MFTTVRGANRTLRLVRPANPSGRLLRAAKLEPVQPLSESIAATSDELGVALGRIYAACHCCAL